MTVEVMTPITSDAVNLALSDALEYPDWLDVGRGLANQKRHIDWLIGDWITFGRRHFPEQVELALEQFGDAKHVKRIEKTVVAFPPHIRCSSLSFDHHAHVADLPTQEALPLLKRAEIEKIDARHFRIEAMLRKVEIGQVYPRDEDHEDDMMLALVRAWNRAPRNVRDDFFEMATIALPGQIEFAA